jgi:hypothetical protein
MEREKNSIICTFRMIKDISFMKQSRKLYEEETENEK